jgi:hypothetical protein
MTQIILKTNIRKKKKPDFSINLKPIIKRRFKK